MTAGKRASPKMGAEAANSRNHLQAIGEYRRNGNLISSKSLVVQDSYIYCEMNASESETQSLKLPRDSDNLKDDQRNDAAAASVQAHMLLMALQNFILPLVQTLIGQNIKENIPNQTTFGREANEFLSALQTFISFIIRSTQSGKRDGIEIDFQDPLTSTVAQVQSQVTRNESKDCMDGDQLPQIPFSKPQPSSGDAVVSTRQLKKDNAPPEKMLASLQQHVFNTMPIRLLSFNRQGSKFKIALLERKEIYAHLASKLCENFNEAKFISDIATLTNGRVTEMEAEDKVIKAWVSRTARYTILSHTWIRASPGEVTYADWFKGEFDRHHAGYRKLVNFCKASWEDYGLTLGWIDTLCINKENSSELDESIRSMYKWYRDSMICLTYLAETTDVHDMHMDHWFTRGWTLQELLAPRRIKFYDTYWKQLDEFSDNDKFDYTIHQQIELATTITQYEMRFIRSVPISRRMQLVSRREVTREEDIVYSVMGIFDVSISIAYGEGLEQAFFRLLKKILSADKFAFDIFNWGGELPSPSTRISSLLPSRPQNYRRRSVNTHVERMRPIEPLTLTHLGLRVPILLMPAMSTPKPSPPYESLGDYCATVTITPVGYNRYVDKIPKRYNLLAKCLKPYCQDGWTKDRSGFQLTFGVLNFGGSETSIRISKTCFAVALKCLESAGTVTTSGDVCRVATKHPIVFHINKKNTFSGKPTSEKKQFDYYRHQYYEIEKSQLANHGMQIVTLCL